MAVYQIDYDLRKNRNYEELYKRIQNYPKWCRPLESTWVISTSQSASQVANNLLQAMDGDDGLLVTRLNGEASWYGIDPKAAAYLKGMLEQQAA
ncbi:MAG: hypothetical protein ACJA05_001564 [Porticoccus sp.]|jgi:hypothetical protein|uniref:hypothetical protein n=1 Tax=Porticoccus sp. TaxID=2024853 RepID=UPI0039E41988